MSLLLQSFELFELWEIELDSLSEFTEFCVGIYYQHHQNSTPPVEEVAQCLQEDMQNYENTHFYALKSSKGKIFGTINVCLWHEGITANLEKEYGIDIAGLIASQPHNPPEVWHIGRFAVDRSFLKKNRALVPHQLIFFKLLLVCAFEHICKYDHNLMIAECDAKLQEKIKLLGIHSQPLGESQMLLGSETIPIINTGQGLRYFYENHKYLLN